MTGPTDTFGSRSTSAVAPDTAVPSARLTLREGLGRIVTGPVTSPTAPADLLAGRSRWRRYVEVGAFVAVWVTAGYLLPLSSNGYLLLGIPLTFGFQLLVRRRPLR